VNISHYKKSIIILIVYVLLFIGIVLFLLIPTINNIQSNKAAIKEQDKEINDNYERLSSLQKNDKNKTEYDQIKNTVENYLPFSLQSSQFIVEVEAVAISLNLSINNISMSETSSAFSSSSSKKTDSTSENSEKTKTKKTGAQQNQFSLSIKTDYPKAMDFLRQMEKMPRFNTINMVDISLAEENLINLKVSGYIYYEQQ
jgi:Tfp pilus assembly protein PilO